MLQSLSIQKPHGPASFARGEASMLSLANAEPADEVAFGLGLEISLARAGDQVVVPDWVQLLPAGPQIEARDRRKWTLKDPNVVLAHFAANGADLAFDINHASEIHGAKGGDAPAQGWIKEMAIREGAVWARVEWNDAGRQAIASKSYRYVSPAMLHSKTGEIYGLASAALVTHPALRMPALANQDRPASTQQDNPNMKTLAQRLAEALGLPADASDDALVTAAATQVSLARQVNDPAKFVPAADLTTALARATTAEAKLAEIEQAGADQKADAAVDAAIAEGKIAPVSREHYVALARNDLATVEKAFASMPVLLKPTKTDRKVDGQGADEHGLDADQLALCSQLNIEPKAFAAQLKGAA